MIAKDVRYRAMVHYQQVFFGASFQHSSEHSSEHPKGCETVRSLAEQPSTLACSKTCRSEGPKTQGAPEGNPGLHSRDALLKPLLNHAAAMFSYQDNLSRGDSFSHQQAGAHQDCYGEGA
jgi:hypothetical protein